jgi:hypothetical protein
MAGRAGAGGIGGGAAGGEPPNGVRPCVVRCGGGPSFGRMAAPGIGGVSDARGAGRGGGDGGAAGGAGGATGSSRTTGVSRDTRATTPGVNVGVGLRCCGCGVENGVEYGIDPRDGGGTGGAGAAGVGAFGFEGRGTGAIGRSGVYDAGAASASDSIMARSAASQPRPALAIGAAAVPVEGAAEGVTVEGTVAASMPMRMTAPQTEQRARTPPGGTFAGSTRKIELHSAHETFTAPPWLWLMRPA